MANNRMYIKHIPSGERLYLGKYYPSTGWYAFDSLADKYNEFMDRMATLGMDDDVVEEWRGKEGFGAPYANHTDVMFGEDFELVYE